MLLLSGLKKITLDVALKALYAERPPSPVEVIPVTQQGEGVDSLTQLLHQNAAIYAVLEVEGRARRFFLLLRAIRTLNRKNYAWQIAGLGGATENPWLVTPLKRTFMRYINTVAFRGSTPPWRFLVKRLVGVLPSSLTWHGPLILVATPTPQSFDRFVLLTDERQIAFLFKPDAAVPWAVRKSGSFEELDVERRNHAWAVQLLGTRVPALLEADEKGALTMEALPERLLGNMVAQAWVNRRKVFIREACRHFEFCRKVYRCFVKGETPQKAEVGADEVVGLIDGITQLLQDSSEAAQVTDALKAVVGMSLPRMIQHCDFCVRNVLVVGGDRDRVLIDWEDMRGYCWPLIDFSLLHLSLKEAYAAMFNVPLNALNDHSEIVEAIAEARADLAELLDLDGPGMRQATLLSLAYLCRQNLTKKRHGTARSIFAELERVAVG